LCTRVHVSLVRVWVQLKVVDVDNFLVSFTRAGAGVCSTFRQLSEG